MKINELWFTESGFAWVDETSAKEVYCQEVARLRKEFKEHDTRFVLPINEWKASNQKSLGINVLFINKYFVLESYHIKLEYIPKMNGNAESLPNH